VQVCPPLGDGVSVNLYNSDILNVVTVGTTPNVAQNATNAAPVQPLTNAVLPADFALYAVAPAGTAPLVIIPEGGSISPSPAQIAIQIAESGLALQSTQLEVQANTDATQTAVSTVNTTLGTPAQHEDVVTTLPVNIAATGVPLLSKGTLVVNQGATVIAASGTANLGPFTMTQLGYEISVSLQANAASTTPFASVTLVWTDSVSGAVVAKEQWWLAGGSGVAQVYMGTGPTKGDTLNISVQNFDAVNSMTYTLVKTQNSRIYARDDWRQNTLNAVPTFTLPNQNPSSNTLAELNPNIAGNTTAIRLLPLYAGDIQLCVANGAGTLVVSVEAISDQAISATAASLAQFVLAAAAVVNQKITLTRAVCQIVLQTTTATASQPGVFAAISEQQT